MSHDEQARHCDRCDRAARANGEDPLRDDWIRTYNGAVDDGPTGLLCPDCADDESIVEDRTRNAEADAIIVQGLVELELDKAYGRPPGGRRSDAMFGILPPGN